MNKKVHQSKQYRTRHYMVKGVYYLYYKSEVVYVGMSTTNCLRRIISHYDDPEKKFDSFQIFNMHNFSNNEILEKEKNAIKRKLPKYNKVHANLIDNKYWTRESD